MWYTARRMAPSDVFAVIMAGGSWILWAGPVAYREAQAVLAADDQAATHYRDDGAPVGPDHAQAYLRGVRRTPRQASAEALPKLPKQNLVVEPEARNTAPAIALATAYVAHQDPDGVIVVLPSDQHVADQSAFRAALEQAIAAARSGAIVTLGIRPTRPETGYGWGASASAGSVGAAQGGGLRREPDRAGLRATSPRASTWNAGIFVFTAKAMLQALATHMPDLSGPLSVVSASLGTKRAAAVLKREFKKMPSTSIDYGVAEKAENILVVPCDCGWSDVGSFNALPEVQPVDARGNVVLGGHGLVIDSSNCIVVGGERPVAVVGMTDVVVVDAGDAVLVLPRDKCQDVRKVVEALRAKKLLKYL